MLTTSIISCGSSVSCTKIGKPTFFSLTKGTIFEDSPIGLEKWLPAIWLLVNAKDERKATDTDEQFFYKSRKKAIGPFKRQMWDLPADVKARLAAAYDAKFEFLFTQLAVGGTKAAVAKHVKAPSLRYTSAGVAAPDDADLSD